jgi:type I restriction enzyme, S subunit
MELKKGYKKTVVGIIPEDWSVTKLEDIAILGRGRVISHREIDSSSNSLYPVYSSQTLNNGVMGYIDTYDFEGEYLTWTTDGVNAGAVFYRNGRFNCTNVCGTIKLKKHDARFVAYVLGTKTRKYVATNLANPKLMNNVTKMIPFPIPTNIDEQLAIATALNDVDDLITSLDKLIAKKRLIKQGVMQELLTGKTRLPGFSGEWEVIRLEKLADIRSGGTPSTLKPDYWDGGILWCTPTDITGLKGKKYLSTTNRTISPLGIKNSSAEIIPSNSIVMTSRATIGECAINIFPVATNQGFKNIVPFDNVDVEFLYYLMSTKKPELICLSNGSTFLEITKNQLRKIELQVPISKIEQKAISNVLSDMDSEIFALEKRREKTYMLKQGMMQELLTGRIRLL